MRLSKIYILILVFISTAFAYDEILVSKNDLHEIAESLIENGDYYNAVAIHQQILDYQINTFGLNNIEAAKTSEVIGKLLVMTSNFEDAELYITQSIKIQSNLLLQKQLETRSSIELLKEIYNVKNDSLGYEYVSNQLKIITKADSINLTNFWAPITYGLENVNDIDTNNIEDMDQLYFQSKNLIYIADSYFEADLYFDALINLLRAIAIDTNNISIPFLKNYLSSYSEQIPYILSALIDYSIQDSTYSSYKDLLLGMIYLHQEERDLSNRHVDSYLKNNFKDSRAYQLKGDYFMYNEDYLSALFHYRKSDQIQPNDLYSLYQQSLCLIQLEKYNEAILVLNRVIKAEPYHQDAYYYRGLAHTLKLQYNNAVNDFTDHILINPDNLGTYYYLGICYYNIQQYHRAKEALVRYIKFENENPDAHYYLGLIYENILDIDKAITHFSIARKFNTQFDDSNLRLGLIHYNLKKYSKAIEPLRDYIINNPDSLSVLDVFAQSLYSEQRYPESIDAYQRLYQSNPTNADYLIAISNAYIELDDMVSAKDMLTKVILLGNVNADIVFTLAKIESELQDYNNAITHFQMAIQMGSPTIEMYYNLAMSYANVGNYMQALIAFKNAYEKDTSDHEIIYQIAVCYKQLEMYEDSRFYLELFIKEYPNDYIAHFLMGELYLFDSNFSSSKIYFKKALSMNPNDYTSLYYLGICDFENKEYIDAAKHFKKSIKINPEHAPSYYHLALVYDILGKTREVKKQMNIIYMLDQALHDDLKIKLEQN